MSEVKSNYIDLEKNGYFGVPENIAKEYIEMLQAHIIYVMEAGKELGVPRNQLAIHDNSKWSKTEFGGYALHFKDNNSVPDLFASAWLHHIHNNPHHWQHWIFSDECTPKNSNVENGVVEMPPCYTLEMVADWMGASMVCNGTNDMSDWLATNINCIKVHSNTAKYLNVILSELGYKDIVNTYAFANGYGC